jgi:hypothetical protein
MQQDLVPSGATRNTLGGTDDRAELPSRYLMNQTLGEGFRRRGWRGAKTASFFLGSC